MPLKIGGLEMKGPKEVLIVIPRDDHDIPFKFIAVNDDSEFHKICPEPTPPMAIKPGEGKVAKYDDPGYKAALGLYAEQRESWYVLKSLEPSKIEWLTIRMDDPKSWVNWRTELKEAGFSVMEIQLIYSKFLEANMVTEQMLWQARERFLASQQADLSTKQ